MSIFIRIDVTPLKQMIPCLPLRWKSIHRAVVGGKYEYGSGVNRVQVVLSGFSVRLFCLGKNCM